MWGRELKYVRFRKKADEAEVDLYVRSWIEIITMQIWCFWSNVDLYVRSWIEIGRSGSF